jgi:hypothetical protein
MKPIISCSSYEEDSPKIKRKGNSIMCFFPHINTDFTGEAFRAGVKEFGCGYCPECLQKRSRSWVVRAFYERETSGSCMMLTLTYDHFKRDKKR